MNITDMAKLTQKNINGENTLTYRRSKTGSLITVIIGKELRAIMDKYSSNKDIFYNLLQN